MNTGTRMVTLPNGLQALFTARGYNSPTRGTRGFVRVEGATISGEAVSGRFYPNPDALHRYLVDPAPAVVVSRYGQP